MTRIQRSLLTETYEKPTRSPIILLWFGNKYWEWEEEFISTYFYMYLLQPFNLPFNLYLVRALQVLFILSISFCYCIDISFSNKS